MLTVDFSAFTPTWKSQHFSAGINFEKSTSQSWLGLRKDGTSYNCIDSEIDTVKSFLKSGVVSKDFVDSINIGEYHIAGRYAGIYSGGGDVHLASEGIGNPKTGKSQSYLLENDSKQLKSFLSRQYMVVIADDDFSSHPMEFNNINISQTTSKSDSMFNMKNSFSILQKMTSKFIANGIGGKLYPYGWAVPSLHLTAFIYQQINNIDFITNSTVNNNNPANKWNTMKNKDYWTSTLISGTSLVYAQSFTDDSVVYACPMKNMQKFVRGVLLIPIK